MFVNQYKSYMEVNMSRKEKGTNMEAARVIIDVYKRQSDDSGRRNR